jgi:type I restriction enzyme R subunit
MIGRGTRLCPDVFGPDQPKEHFLIFDVCGNFEFFDVHKKGKDSSPAKPVTQQIFEARLQLSRLLAETGETENIELAHSYLGMLHKSVEMLDRDRFQVNMHLKYVEEFSERKRWNNLSADDVHQIEEHLSALPSPEVINEIARRFDLMMLKLQLANLLMLSVEQGYHEKLLNIADELGKKYTIPQVLNSKELIEALKDPNFYKDLSQKKLDAIRGELRGLVIYLDQKGMTPIYTDIKDSEAIVNIGDPLKAYGSAIYKKRVESFIREHKHQITIAKLNTNKPITNDELHLLEHILFDGGERGSKDDYIKEYGEQPLGTFVRSILGLDLTAAEQAFADFLQAGNLQADQMTFVKNIISYLTKNGVIDKKMLFEAPFTDVNDQGLLGVFSDADAKRIIRIIDRVNGNAGGAS